MTWVHPWAIWLGLAAASLPVAVHLLTRPRPRRLALSTIRFVREALRQRRARNRLRDAVILGLRTLAVLLLAWAIARPLIGRQPLIAPDETTSAARVVLLDVSQSMAAAGHGVQVFERARTVAADYLTERTGLEAALVLAGATDRPVFDRLSRNIAALRAELAAARPRPERLNVQAAINRARDLLSRSPPASQRELVVVSDFQRTNWSAVDFSPLPEDTRIQLESVAPADPLPNLAILGVGSPARVEQGREVPLEVEVGNFSPSARQVQVEVVLGDSVTRLEGLSPAGARTTLAAQVASTGAGWQAGLARLVNVADALPADDSRPFVLEVRRPPTYALITHQPADRRPSSSYYLERALVPLAARPEREGSRVVRLDPSQIDAEALAAADILVLDHPGRLNGEGVRRLANLLRRGRSILYVAAETQDATNLKLLADAAGTDLQLPVEFSPPPRGTRRRDLFLADVRRDQAPFTVFGDGLGQLTSSLRFSGGLASRRREETLADDVVAGFSDRSACLVVSACGEGVLAVLNADLEASNLASSPAFVPLIGELTARLLGRQRGQDAVACGEPAAVPLPVAAGPAAGLRITGPDASGANNGQLAEEGGGVLWRATGLTTPGTYQVRRGDAVVYALAVPVPAEESDLRPIDPTVLPERLAGGRALHFHQSAGAIDERDQPWAWLAAACVVCLLLEIGALKWFRT